MSLEAIGQQILEFVRTHEAWAAPIVFALAFAESLAFVSLLAPATVVLVGVGALIGASGIGFVPIWLAASIGAALGDWLSYWIGLKLEHSVAKIWPLSRYPDLLPRGEAFMRRWGVASVFIGRFFGPVRAVIPLVAGIFAMPFWPFQLANWSSAFLWGIVVLAPGTFGMKFIL
jgi:membrane protein DedA with SNARE-associated domain